MRIGIQVEHIDPTRGGSERSVARLASWLTARGHQVHMFADRAVEQLTGTVTHQVTNCQPQAVAVLARRARLDTVLGTGKCLGMNVFNPRFGTVRGDQQQVLARFRNPMLRRLLTALNQFNPKFRASVQLEHAQYSQRQPRPHFVALSRMVRDEMRKYYHVPEDRLHLVYNGVDCDAYTPSQCRSVRAIARREWGLDSGTVCFVLVAHDFARKGVRELIDAASVLAKQKKPIRIVVIGGRACSYQMKRLKSRDRDAQVAFAGPVRDVIRAYAAADVCVLPTWYDACSRTVLEAWACGLPVITTRFNGAGELMTDGCEGFLVDSPADTSRLANRLTDMLDSERRVHMGTLGRNLAERYCEQESFERILRILERTASEASSPSHFAA